MSPDEVLQYISQYTGGDASKARYGYESKEIDNPNPRLREKPGQEKITVRLETWRTPDGQIIWQGYRDPANGEQYIEEKRETPKPTAGTTTAGTASERTAEDIEPDPNNPGHFRRVRRTLNPDGSGKEVIGYDPVSDDVARAAGKLPEKPKEPTTIPTNTTERVVLQRNPDGTTSEIPNPNYVPPKPSAKQTVTLENGTKAVFNPDTGKLEPITLGQSSSSPLPQFDPGTHLSIISAAVQSKLNEIMQDTTLSNEEKLKRAEIIVAQGKLLNDETSTVLTNQANIRTQDISQRTADMTQANQRGTWGNDIYTNAYKNAATAAQYQPAGADAGSGMIGQMLLNAGSIGASGGYANSPQVPQGQAQQQMMGMGMPGMPAININLGGLTLPQNPSAQNILDAAAQPGSPAPIAPTQPTPPGTFPAEPFDPNQPQAQFAASMMGG